MTVSVASSLVMTGFDSASSSTDECDSDFEMIGSSKAQSQPIPVRAKKRKQLDLQHFAFDETDADATSIQSNLTNEQRQQRLRLLQSTSASSTHLQQRVQDRIAMRSFYAQQANEKGFDSVDKAEAGIVSEDDEKHAYADADSESQSEAHANSHVEDAKPSSLSAVASSQLDFSHLSLSRPLQRALTDLGFTQPTAVQHRAIPLALAGRDLLVNAQTGSGKTAAFILPALERLLYRQRRVAATRLLVLLPTRELAAQCENMTCQLAKYTDVRVASCVGGVNMNQQTALLQAKPDILVATPGRLIDQLHNSRGVHLDDVEILVLDEADRLCELGFADEINEILKHCGTGYKGARQTMLFSATLNSHVAQLIDLTLNDPITVTVDAYDSLVQQLKQEFVRVRPPVDSIASDEYEQSIDAIDREREAIILSLCRRSFKHRTIVFCASRIQCHRLMLLFALCSLKASELSGSLTQLQRQAALDEFASGRVDFLIATDLASRGLDIKGVECVLNMSMPKALTQYTHRVGRTCRAGAAGQSVTLVSEKERAALKQLMKRQSEANIQSRVVPAEVLSKYRKHIASLEVDVAALLESERIDKAARCAEMEANKASNLIVHQAEIEARPKRTWFQSEQEKMAAKLASQRLFEHNDNQAAKTEADVKSKKRARDDEDSEPDHDDNDASASASKSDRLARRAAKRAEKNKNPLQGLSRVAKRRKLMHMEAERIAVERMQAAKKIDPTIDVKAAMKRVDPFAISRAAAKKAKHSQAQHDDSTSNNKSKGKGKAGSYESLSSKLRFSHASDMKANNRDDKRYAVAAAARADTTAKATKPKGAKSVKAFKSKAKFKRR